MIRHLLVAGSLTAVLASGCGVADEASNSAIAQPVAHASSVVVTSATSAGLTWPISVGSGYAPINHLATDPSRSGVWFWSWTSQEAYAFFYDPTANTLSSWSLGSSTGADGLDPYGNSGIAVDPSGDVWLGAYNQLVELDPATGAVSRWTIPAPTVDALAPAALQPWHDVNAIAIEGSGRVLIGMTAASSLQIFDPATMTFGSIALPAVGEIAGIATLADGTVGVAMAKETQLPSQDDTMVLISPAGVETTIATSSSFVSTNGDKFLSGGTTGYAAVDADGSTSAMSIAANGSRLIPNVGALTEDGRAVLATSKELAIVTGATTEYITFPSAACTNVAAPPLPSSEPNPDSLTCQVSPIAVAVDAAGNIWVAPNLPQDEVGLIPAGGY